MKNQEAKDKIWAPMVGYKKKKWVRPDQDKRLEKYRSIRLFRCAWCDKVKPWDEEWQSTRENVCSICDSCKKERNE